MSRKIKIVLPVLLSTMLLMYGLWIPVKAEVAQWLLQDAWQKTAEDGSRHKPWSWADHWPVARLKIASLSIDQIVLAGDSGSVLAFAPGYNLNSAALSEKGTIMISGHRDTHFRFMQDIRPGLSITLETAAGTKVYNVTNQQVVSVETTHVDLSVAQDQLLLVTCYPFNSPTTGGPLRYVVTAAAKSI